MQTHILIVAVTAVISPMPADLARQLASPEWADRECASRHLTVLYRLRPDVAEQHVRLLLAHDDAEVRQRAAAVLRRHQHERRVHAAVEVDRRYGVLPFIDAMWFDPALSKYTAWVDLHPWHLAAAVAREYLDRAAPDPSRYMPGDYYIRYREATRLLLIDLRLAGAAWSDLDDFVSLLRSRDFVYCRDRPTVPYAPELPR